VAWPGQRRLSTGDLGAGYVSSSDSAADWLRRVGFGFGSVGWFHDRSLRSILPLVGRVGVAGSGSFASMTGAVLCVNSAGSVRCMGGDRFSNFRLAQNNGLPVGHVVRCRAITSVEVMQDPNRSAADRSANARMMSGNVPVAPTARKPFGIGGARASPSTIRGKSNRSASSDALSSATTAFFQPGTRAGAASIARSSGLGTQPRQRAVL